MARALIGTSGWNYHHWRSGVFYPQQVKGSKAQLAHYATVFDTVEVNSTFYHLPRPSTCEAWRLQSPQGFTFALKGPRIITHRQRLQGSQELLAQFLTSASRLQDRLGPILWQLPPGFSVDVLSLETFLRLHPVGLRVAFEFRHRSWFCDAVYQILARYNAALVWADSPKYPLVEVITASFAYCRLHGHEVMYMSGYSDEQLGGWAGRVRQWLGEGRDVYVYFDNDAEGHAPWDAIRLREMIRAG